MSPGPTGRRRRLKQIATLLVLAALPAGLVQLTAAQPRDRHFHVTSFRYGKQPSVIRVNRGDRVHLSFSTRDTAHSFFLEEFDIDAKIEPGARGVALFAPSDPQARPSMVEEVAFTARHPGWLGPLISKSQYRCHVWCGPMHAFEHGNLIIAPNTLLWAGLGLVLGIPLAGLIGLRAASAAGRVRGSGRDILRRSGLLRRVLKSRRFPVAVAIVMGVPFYLVVLTSLFGTHVGGRNLGIMFTWVVWLFVLIVVLIPLGGRLWCSVCPIPLFGEWLQRLSITRVRSGSTAGTNNRFFGLSLPWPRALANAWPRLILLMALGTFSTVLVAEPRVTGWVLVGMLLAALLCSLVFRLRAFCRYLCPINAFVGLYATDGKLALRSADADTCARCKVHTCLEGGERGWACPYGLCVADIGENTDCGLCLECVKSCVYDNVTLRWRPFASETGLRSVPEAVGAVALLVLACAYCVVHLGHWPAVRDWVNILDKNNWGAFGLYAAALWLMALAVVPGLVFGLAWLGGRLAAKGNAREMFVSSSPALVSVGLMLWMAFVISMLFVNVSFVAQSLSDPFGWGWDFLGTAGTHWHQLWPRAVPWLQVGCVLAGLGYGLRKNWRAWSGATGDFSRALKGAAPLSVFLVLLTAGFVVFFAN